MLPAGLGALENAMPPLQGSTSLFTFNPGCALRAYPGLFYFTLLA